MANKYWTKEKQKEYYERKGKELAKKYYQDSKNDRKEYQSEYYQNNKEEQYKKNRERLVKNKEKYKETNDKWREDNKEKLKIRQRNYMKEYRKKSPTYRLRENIGHYIRQALIDSIPKSGTYKKYLGCSINEYRQYLEKLFKSEMTWENYGTYWEIDHIKAISNFDLTKEEEILKAFHYLNTQPLSIKENRQKSNK